MFRVVYADHDGLPPALSVGSTPARAPTVFDQFPSSDHANGAKFPITAPAQPEPGKSVGYRERQ